MGQKSRYYDVFRMPFQSTGLPIGSLAWWISLFGYASRIGFSMTDLLCQKGHS
jgi:hypothetical protein